MNWKAIVTVFVCCALVQQADAEWTASKNLDAILEQAVQEDRFPGAVLLVGQGDRILHRKAYGSRALVPEREEMSLDTIFDAASLTKVVATSTALMKLVEEGKVRLADPVTAYLPEFQGGKSPITVRQLLTHFSGLRPDLDLQPPWQGYNTGIRLALADKPVAAPGSRFIYSDINFELLGEIIRRVSGKPEQVYVQDEIFGPLGMNDTRYMPDPRDLKRIAPTELLPGDARPLRGVVHDETTRFMGGVAGHAGLFTTADDLAKWCQMLIQEGEYNGKRLLSAATVRKFTTPQTPPHQPVLRGLGFDIDSPFSSNRGELFPIGSYGHTGFTGTSVWLDPMSKTYVILLTNSVHPRRRPAPNPIRAKVATVVAAAVGHITPTVLLTGYHETHVPNADGRVINRDARVETGLEAAAKDRFKMFGSQRIGLITNHTGLSGKGERNIDVMQSGGVKLVALFSPEHGIAGKEDHEQVGDARDAASGLPVYSLYSGPRREPNEEMLRNVDALAFDIQDVGARFYTYMCTMANSLKVAGRLKKPFYVLDRPNPITGVHVEGPLLDPDKRSFVGCANIPVRHGMTMGEMALLVNAEEGYGADVRVIRMTGWQRGDWWDSTHQPWVNPSPNMRSLNAALLYPGLCLLEYSKNWSLGRGTDSPFEQVGASWIKGSDLSYYLNQRKIPGVRAYPTAFTPDASNFKGQRIEGVRFVITDRDSFHSTRLGLELAAALLKLYPGKLDVAASTKLIGSAAVIEALNRGDDPRALSQRLDEELAPFLARRAKYLQY